jgi:hypothetical protein
MACNVRGIGNVVVSAAAGLLFLCAGPADADGRATGRYVANGKAARLEHVRIVPARAYAGKASFRIVVSEKDSSRSQDPALDASFGDLGDALVIGVTEEGAVFGAQVCHQSLKHAGFSSIGPLKVDAFRIENGVLTARFFTNGEEEFSGDTWEVDLSVEGRLPVAR